MFQAAGKEQQSLGKLNFLGEPIVILPFIRLTVHIFEPHFSYKILFAFPSRTTNIYSNSSKVLKQLISMINWMNVTNFFILLRTLSLFLLNNVRAYVTAQATFFVLKPNSPKCYFSGVSNSPLVL